MIVIKLWGGLGNQLFQIAFGYVLKKKEQDEVIYDIEFYNNQPSHTGTRKYVSKHQFPKLILNTSFKRPLFIRIFENRYITHICKLLGGLKFQIFEYSIFIEPRRKFQNNIPYSRGMHNYYDGYWQSGRYFEQYREDIIQLFKPSEEIRSKVISWRNSINSSNCVAVHIRRGDYVRKSPNDMLIGVKFYKRAIEYLRTQLESPIFCIFSDDINWCKEQLGLIEDIQYVERYDEDADLLDLFSIAACDHGIMSISTFSWWGNWLRSKNRESLVLYPEGTYFNNYFMQDNWVKFKN